MHQWPDYQFGVDVLAGFSANLEVGFAYEAQPDIVKKTIDNLWFCTAGSTVNVMCGLAANRLVAKGLLTLGTEVEPLPQFLEMIEDETEEEFAKRSRLEVDRILKRNRTINGFITSDLETWGIDVRPLPWRLTSPCSPIKNRRERDGRRIVHYYPHKGEYLEDRLRDGLHVIEEEVRVSRPKIRLASGVRVADMVVVEPLFTSNGVPSLRVLNPGTDLLQDAVLLPRALQLSDFVVMNSQELRLLKLTLDVAGPEDIFRYGVTMLLVTDGENGATLYRPNHQPLHQPAFDVVDKDATGAGDCFLSHFLTGILRGDTKEAALRFAAAAAAVQTTMQGGSSVPNPSAISRLLAEGRIRVPDQQVEA